jgi:hypothetical protein
LSEPSKAPSFTRAGDITAGNRHHPRIVHANSLKSTYYPGVRLIGKMFSVWLPPGGSVQKSFFLFEF